MQGKSCPLLLACDDPAGPSKAMCGTGTSKLLVCGSPGTMALRAETSLARETTNRCLTGYGLVNGGNYDAVIEFEIHEGIQVLGRR